MSLLRDYATALTQPALPLSPADARARFDEVVAPDGSVRPAWKGLAARAADLTPSALDRIDREIAGLLADDGVTYVTPDRGPEPWRLDPVPFVVDAATWAKLDVGLAQRAELLSAILADVYGEQRLLAEGIVPAAVVFGHAGFSRAMAGRAGLEAQSLLLSGTDLGRDAAGDWHVLADRVQAPSGLGYALANRRVMSRVLPELYEEAGLHRMEPYFSAVRAALLQTAPAEVADPRIVVLSPGTHSETAYDQAFLANILGFPLVQGGDLVVRDGWVWLKPAGYPRRAPRERVDVIVRRVDAEWCDPLELRAGSQLGVAGLTEVLRRGRVRLVNGLGTGVLENSGLLPYLPAACERLLGEQLRLPSVPSWWCGDAEARTHVLNALAEGDPTLLVREIDGRTADLDGIPPAVLAARIEAAPHRYVGQERMPLSQAPAWGDAGRTTRQVAAYPFVLRTFTVRSGGVFRPLAGGLATLTHDGRTTQVTKDVWVLKAAASDPDQGLANVAPLAVPRTTPLLGPRALADMFWVGRYAERAEDLLRLVITAQAYAEQLSFASPAQGDAVLQSLVGAIQRLVGTRWDDPDAELRSLVLDHDRAGSAAHSLDRLRDALEGVRDQLSSDTWRTFGITDRAMKVLRGSDRTGQLAESAGRMLTGILSLQGVTASMMRDDGWHLLEAGRYLERALQVCALLGSLTRVPSGAGVERAVMSGVLMSAESAVTHRRRYRGDVRAVGMLELLLQDPANPRSVAFALTRLRFHLSELTGSTGSTRPERLLENIEETIDLVDVAGLSIAEDGRRARLDDFLSATRAHLHHLGDGIAQLHFESGPQPQPLSLSDLLAVS